MGWAQCWASEPEIPSRLFPQNVGEQGFQACHVVPLQDSIHRENNKMQGEQHPLELHVLLYVTE